MMKCLVSISAFLFILNGVCGQEDSLDNERLAKMISLSEVVMRSDLNVATFIRRVKEDTSFYKAFRNLNVVEFTALNDIRLVDKKGKLKASLNSKTRQHRRRGCRSVEVLEEKTTGDFFDRKHDYNYFTGKMYASLFIPRDSACGETNIVKGAEFSLRSKKGVEKNKEQLKMLFFNPGKKIRGIPFMGDKIDIFDPDRARYYHFSIDRSDFRGEPCFIFTIRAREDLPPGREDKIIIDNMVTWFHARTMEVLARTYDMSYNAGVYDFDVHMEVELGKVGPYLLPHTIRYKGNWDLVFKKRERGTFTATLFDFDF